MKRLVAFFATAAIVALSLLPVSAGIIPAVFAPNASGGSTAYQSPAFVQGVAAETPASSTSITAVFAGAQTAGDLDVVAINYSSASVTVSSVVDSSGNTYAAASALVTVSGNTQVIYYAPNIAAAGAGANTVTVTISSGATFLAVRAAEYSGIATSSPLDNIPSGGGNTGTSTALASGTATTTQPDLIVGAMFVQNTVSAAGAGFTTRVTTTGGNTLEDKNVTATGLYAATATQNVSGFWAANMVAFKAAPTTQTFQTPAFVQGNFQGGVSTPLTTKTVTYTSAQRGNDLNVVEIGWSNSTSTIVSVSDSSGNSYAVASPLVSVSGQLSSVMYYAQNISAAAAGANTITVTLSAAAPFLDISAAEYSGIATTGALDAKNGAANAAWTALNSGNVTTAVANELLVGTSYVAGSTTAGGAGYIVRSALNVGDNVWEDKNVTATGTYSAASTQTPSGAGVMQVATFEAATGQPAPPSTFGVQASGNKLISTQTGTTVQLIGSAASGCEMFTGQPSRCSRWAAQTPSFWSGTWASQSPGWNAVRLPINSQMWIGPSALGASFNGTSCTSLAGSGTGAAYQANIQQIVANANAGGIYVILDLHIDGPPGQCAIGQPGSISTYATQMWTQVAQMFGGNPGVIFEIFNEPFGDNVFCDGFGASNCGSITNPNIGAQSTLLANGGTQTPYWRQNNAAGDVLVETNISYTAVGEKQILATIRAAGATNLVLASPWWYAGEIELWPQTYGIASGNPDPLHNFGASMHGYGYSKAAPGTTSALTVVANDGYPLVITEFQSGQGLGLGDTIGYLTTGTTLLNSVGVDGLFGWAANTYGGAPAFVDSHGNNITGW